MTRGTKADNLRPGANGWNVKPREYIGTSTRNTHTPAARSQSAQYTTVTYDLILDRRRTDTWRYGHTCEKGAGMPHGTVASTHCAVQSALCAKSAALFFTFCLPRPHLRLVSLSVSLSSFFAPPLAHNLGWAGTPKRNRVTRHPKGRAFFAPFSYLRADFLLRRSYDLNSSCSCIEITRASTVQISPSVGCSRLFQIRVFRFLCTQTLKLR